MFRVIVEQEAKDNLRTHYQNLVTRYSDSEYPRTWYFGIRRSIRDLARTAAQCGEAYESRYFAETIRQRLLDSYKILFVIRGNHVHVLHVRHQSQDPRQVEGQRPMSPVP